MVIAYLDTSAAMKLLVDEAESNALVAYVRETCEGGSGELAAALLLHTELQCAARRHPAAIDATAVGQVLDAVTLVDITRGDLLTAGSLPGVCGHPTPFTSPSRSASAPTH